MNEISKSERRMHWLESETVRSWGNHIFKGLTWVIIVSIASCSGSVADIISIKISWPVLG